MTLATAALSIRGNYQFAEVTGLLGPEAIGVTGDNSYETLYGRPYVLVLTNGRYLRLFRGAAGGGSFTEVFAGLPTSLFGVALPEGVRHVTAAFDQSARINVAYEVGGIIEVTRWDTSLNQYIQNVSFAGVDPCLLMDATLVDPRGFPSAADGWSVREAYYAGIPVQFYWVPDGSWRDNPITDSDVVLFYLTTDRLGVRARVQRQIYATVNTIHDFASPVIMDRVVALAGKYELLVSDAAGDVLPEMLVSDPYVSDFFIYFEANETLFGYFIPENAIAVQESVNSEGYELVSASFAPESVGIVSDTAFRSGYEILDGLILPEDINTTSDVVPYEQLDSVDGSFAPEGMERITQTVFVDGEEGLHGIFEPESIRVQTV